MICIHKSQSAGFSLIELIVAVAILAILVTVGYPYYQSQMLSARRADGKAKLLEIMQIQQKYFSNNNTYTTDLINDLGFDNAGGGAVASENDAYSISAALCDPGTPITQCVELTATALGPQTSDGNLTVNSLNQKTPVDKW